MTHAVPARIFRTLFSAALLTIFLSSLVFAQDDAHRGRKYTPPPATAKITVTVTKATNGKPIENAAVVFHPMKSGKDEGNLELKTNEEGKASIDVIPIGDTVRLQVIASGYQTFGDDYEITTDSKDIDVKMKRPARQYSIYEKHDNSVQGGADSKPDSSTPPPANQPAKPPQSN
jgi:Carboxypeptidase regulatory-like domain